MNLYNKNISVINFATGNNPQRDRVIHGEKRFIYVKKSILTVEKNPQVFYVHFAYFSYCIFGSAKKLGPSTKKNRDS